MQNLILKDFCTLFDVSEEDMPQECKKIIHEKDFRYTRLSEIERDEIILNFLRRIDQNTLDLSGENKTKRWERGWGEILNKFKKSCDKKDLIPQYNKYGTPIRLFGNYAKTADGNFENNFIDLLRTFIFQKYFRSRDYIYEFGCGSAYNLVALAEMDQTKHYFGSDWVPQSAEIIELASKEFGYNIQGSKFDMFHPDHRMEVHENSAMFTFGSLEQLGKKYHDFLNFLLGKPFDIYVHVNSILECYDETSLPDYLTYRFEQHRNYCDGFFTSLQKLESEGKIRILKMHRVQFGGYLGDGYSLTVWSKIES